MKDLNVGIKVENLDELKRLLQKATDQVEQLQETIRKIENFKLLVAAETTTKLSIDGKAIAEAIERKV